MVSLILFFYIIFDQLTSKQINESNNNIPFSNSYFFNFWAIVQTTGVYKNNEKININSNIEWVLGNPPKFHHFSQIPVI